MNGITRLWATCCAPRVGSALLRLMAVLAVMLSGVGHAAQTYLKQLTSDGNVLTTATAVSPTDGSIYVAGTFDGVPLVVGSTTLPLSGTNKTGFLVKLGADGSWRWGVTLSDNDNQGTLTPRALTVTANHVYITGDARNGVAVNARLRSGAYVRRLSRTNASLAPFVVRLDTEAGWGWAAMASNSETGLANAYGYDVAVDRDGGVYICGSFRSDVISDNTTLGLNFGNHHAFRARDASSSPSGTDWGRPGSPTRDGFVAKLEGASGTWRWVATGGGKEDEVAPGTAAAAASFAPYAGGFYGIAVDSANSVYVIGNVWGNRDLHHRAVLLHARMNKAKWEANPMQGYTDLDPPNDASAYVAKLAGTGTAEGTWAARTYMCIPTPNPGGTTVWYGNPTYARGIEVVQDQVYITYQQAFFGGNIAAGGANRQLQVRRLLLDLSASNAGAAVVVRGEAGTNNVAYGSPLTFDRSGNLYLSGTFSYPGALFVGGGQTNDFPLAAGTNIFAAKLSPDLTWDWTQVANGTMPVFEGVQSAADPQTGRMYIVGSFSNGALELGDLGSEVRMPTTGDQGANATSFISAIQTSGKFLEQVRFELLTDYGADQAIPPQTPQTLFLGNPVTASVPPILYEDAAGGNIDPLDNPGIANRAVVRHICIGYEVVDTGITGAGPSYTFTIDGDTQVRFRWRTEYALDVRNDLSGSNGGLTSTAAGNPEPVVQKHWIEDGTIMTTFIDGVIPSLTEFGTRYRSVGYRGTGSAMGILGQVLDFNGIDQHVDLGGLPATNFNQGVTIEAWVKYDSFKPWSGIFEAATADGANTIFLANVEGTSDLNFRVYDGSTVQAAVTARNVLKIGQWMHVAATLDPAGVATIYVNGVFAASTSNGAGKLPPAITRERSFIGWGPASELAHFDGRIGEVRLWNLARSATEIRLGQFQSMAGSEAGLLGYWKLADLLGQGTPVTSYRTTDSALSGIHGTFVNGAVSDLVSGQFTSFVPWASVQQRQQVPQFRMNAPASVEYTWVREQRVQISVAPPSLAPGLLAIGGGQTNEGAGEFWFTNKSRVVLIAPERARSGTEDYAVKGYINAVGNITPSVGDGTKAGINRQFVISSLEEGSALTWNYSDRIYRGLVFIGDPISFATNGTFVGAEAIPADSQLDDAAAPVATTIISGSPAGSTIEDMRIWDDVDNKLYPLRPGTILLEWPRKAGASSERNILTEIRVAFRTNNPSFLHVANTPPVPLDSDKTNTVSFVALKYSQSDKTTVDDVGEFSVPGESLPNTIWSVLLFSERMDGTPANGDLEFERLRVRTVLTRKWSQDLRTATATIGDPITSPQHGGEVPHNGYLYFPNARYNAGIHDRETRVGPIIPVNTYPNAPIDETMVIVWYRTQEGIHWPYQTVQYTPQWPTDGRRIVVASRLGSEGVDTSGKGQLSFNTEEYSDVSIYNQPDRTLPGFNPNEEHAFLAPSLLNGAAGNPPPVAYALRNNLNVLSGAGYTSHPYVLVQYFDKAADDWRMGVYAVQIQDPAIAARRHDIGFGANLPNVTLATDGTVEFNVSGYGGAAGLKGDEAVDLEPNGNLRDVAPGRYYVVPFSETRFYLARSPGGEKVTTTGITTGTLPTVTVTRAFPYVFDYVMTAGEPVLAPYPLQQIIGATACANTSGESLLANQLVYWEDHRKQPWAVAGSLDPAAGLRARFFYPMHPAFWHPSAAAGDCLAYVADPVPLWVTNRVRWPQSVPTLKAGETLVFSGGEVNRDNPNAPGVPGVIGWAAGRVVYDDANPAMDPGQVLNSYMARLASPLTTLGVNLPIGQVPVALQPAGGRVQVTGTQWFFKDLNASIQSRIFYDQSGQRLSVRGFMDGKTIGDSSLTAAPSSIPVLQPNILTEQDAEALRQLAADSTAWVAAVNNLVRLSRDPRNIGAQGAGITAYGVGLEPTGAGSRFRHATQFGPGLALLPNGRLLDPTAGMNDGYVTLAENDDPSLGAAPVVLHIVRVRKDLLFRGAIKTLNPVNPFDEKITLRHAGDFGGNAGDLEFQWYYRPDDGRKVAPPELAPASEWALFPTPNSGRGAQEINLAGAGEVTLSDNRFFARWKHRNGTIWSDWAGAANSRPPQGTNELAQDTYVPQLAEGWVKRVLAAVNPFDARISDFRNNDSPATYASMVQQAGASYRGPVALNADQDVIENVGLIELYTTVIQRAKNLSIDLSTPISTPAVNNAILLAASRVADLQLLLGNEAYTDAQDSTIGFGTDSTEYGFLAPTIFTFQNQVATLMEEELALLRGRDEEGAYPVFNRLLWNFTRAEGEAAYALSYNITDRNSDGFINEADARILFPQGHGDAWGHYLSAIRTYYDLLRHPNFNWQSRSETLAIDGVVLNVDYLDERKFAQIAAAKAKAGADVVNLTYRSRYVEDPDGQWQGYKDTDASRGWGVVDWGRRTGSAALYDWVTANAILPANDTTHTGIQKVDRSSVKELSVIAAHAMEVRKQLDNANGGLNPIGLATDVVPFDIDPSFLEVGSGVQGESHFDQVYGRAIKALQNAVEVFNHANQLNNMLRQVDNTVEQFARDTESEDIDFRNRLIEIFGTPYEGNIGPGKAYPAGYSGPDLYTYMYVDVTGLSKDTVPPTSTDFAAFFAPMAGGFIKLPGGEADTITSAFSTYYKSDNVTLEGNTGTDYSEVLELNMPVTASGYSFQAPPEWGQRRAPGEIQQTLSELVQSEADLDLALADYAAHMGAIKELIDLIKAQSDLGAESIRIADKGLKRTILINSTLLTGASVIAAAKEGEETAETVSEAAIEGLPTVVGVASDAFSGVRSTIRNLSIPIESAFSATAMAAEKSLEVLESSKEIKQMADDIEVQKAEFRYAIQEQLRELTGMLGEEAPKRVEVFRRQEALRQVSDKYRSLLETGLRLMEERALHNKRTAAITQRNRYQDFTFRVARNEALSKYRASFDLAARFAYLAAKAYDYETNLDPNDAASALPILTQIIRTRTLGAMVDGNPRLGSGGLADALATLKVNYDVLKTQMGFNNPQSESGRFSLRNELFRILPGPMIDGERDLSTNAVTYDGRVMTAEEAWATSDAKWSDALQNTSAGNYSSKVMPDLWQLPEFRRYCRPFAPESAGAQPGLVITFGSQIVFGKNFFGWPLAGGDSTYDPSHFATKVRTVGLWFENYNGGGLSLTPRAYLVPVGLDIMMIPSSNELATREWNVVDQRIPVPLPVSRNRLRDPNWIPMRDSLNGSLAEIRRFSMFRAYHDGGFSTDEMSTDSRLIGRSVWNTRWMLIIPGGTLLSDGKEGLDTFVRGRVVPGSNPAVRDGSGIQDIKIYFQTYAYSGN